jgi:hypothetical protein
LALIYRHSAIEVEPVCHIIQELSLGWRPPNALFLACESSAGVPQRGDFDIRQFSRRPLCPACQIEFGCLRSSGRFGSCQLRLGHRQRYNSME